MATVMNEARVRSRTVADGASNPTVVAPVPAAAAPLALRRHGRRVRLKPPPIAVLAAGRHAARHRNQAHAGHILEQGENDAVL